MEIELAIGAVKRVESVEAAERHIHKLTARHDDKLCLQVGDTSIYK